MTVTYKLNYDLFDDYEPSNDDEYEHDPLLIGPVTEHNVQHLANLIQRDIIFDGNTYTASEFNDYFTHF